MAVAEGRAGMSEEGVVAAVSAANARAHIEHITTQIPSRLAGSENGRRMAEYSAEALGKAGVAARVLEMPGLVSFPERGGMRVLPPFGMPSGANRLAPAGPPLPAGIPGTLRDAPRAAS